MPVLRSKDEPAQNQQIQCALQQFQSFSCILGRHITRVSARPGKMSTQNRRESHPKLVCPGLWLKASGGREGLCPDDGQTGSLRVGRLLPTNALAVTIALLGRSRLLIANLVRAGTPVYFRFADHPLRISYFGSTTSFSAIYRLTPCYLT